MSSERKSTRGAINAADLAVAEGELYTAEEALQKAMRELRREQEKNRGGSDADE